MREQPLCPHGCYKRKGMQWCDDRWYCPKCGDEWDDIAELYEEITPLSE